MGEPSWKFRVKHSAWSSDLLFSYFNDMIEKLCLGLALCSVYKHLLLLSSSNIILPVRAALSALPLVWKPGLWSAHVGYCALQTLFLLHVEL